MLAAGYCYCLPVEEKEWDWCGMVDYCDQSQNVLLHASCLSDGTASSRGGSKRTLVSRAVRRVK